jgi:hypothetical protein
VFIAMECDRDWDRAHYDCQAWKCECPCHIAHAFSVLARFHIDIPSHHLTRRAQLLKERGERILAYPRTGYDHDDPPQSEEG